MKIKLLILFFYPMIVFGQLDKDLQSKEVYANNNVFSRELSHTNTSSVGGIILVFDENGKLKDEYLKDNQNRNKYQFKYSYIYNDSGQLTYRMDTSFYQFEIYVSNCKYSYEMNALKYCECIDQNNKLTSKIVYENNGLKTTESLYRGDSIYRTQTTEYDSIGYKVRFFGNSKGSNIVRNFQINGKTFKIEDPDLTWNYKFVNIYENGMLITQIRYENEEKKESEEFQYNKKGLLVSKINSSRGTIGSQEVYKYKFRKE